MLILYGVVAVVILFVGEVAVVSTPSTPMTRWSLFCRPPVKALYG